MNRLFGQNNTNIMEGRVTDDKNNPIDLALISLLSKQDSTYIVSDYTDLDGSFEFTKLPLGNYVLQISILGFQTFESDFSIEENESKKDVGIIQISPLPSVLDAITITEKKPYIERKTDRTIINPDALLANTGSSTLEALERAPGISVDQNGNIKLKGRAGVTVYVDDKPTYLGGAELENYLRSIPTSTVKQIEIMTNPPARYEAAGNSGIINIITKRNKNVGLNGNVVLSLQQGLYTRSNNSLNLSYNKNKWSLYVNINGGFRNSFQDLYINRYYKNENNETTSSFSQNSFIVKDGISGNGKIGFDYYHSPKTTFGFSLKKLSNPNGDKTDNTAFIRNKNKEILNRVLADNVTKNTFDNVTYSVYLKQMFGKKGSTLTFDADYVNYSSRSNQVFKNTIYDILENIAFQNKIDGDVPSSIDIIALKSDFVVPLNSTSKFETGVKTANTNTNNEAIYNNTIESITLPDYNLSNRFLYDEWIHAGYVNYTKSYKRIELQLGLRAEITSFKGNQRGNVEKPDTSFTRMYNNLFPTLYLSWTMDTTGIHVMNFSFGRRIDRPFFQDLNPFILPLDKFTFYSGNPDLLPTYSNNFSLTYSYKNNFNTSLNYSKTLDGINETLEIKEGIYYSRPGNIATNHTLSISVDGAFNISKWLGVNSYFEVGHQIFRSPLYTEILNTSGTYCAGNINTSFQLGKGWIADLRGDYQSDVVYAQLLIKSFGTINIGVQKKILKDKGSLKLNLNDIFIRGAQMESSTTLKIRMRIGTVASTQDQPP
ncbi:MAG: outer membrane beta-barrel protein [Saprospiraceae bacterium]|nr:outer membrane beta-barrel protein [Saprospiraceae bacterium]